MFYSLIAHYEHAFLMDHVLISCRRDSTLGTVSGGLEYVVTAAQSTLVATGMSVTCPKLLWLTDGTCIGDC